MTELLAMWRAWKDDKQPGHGYAKLRDLFQHLKDVRPWGPQDRLKMVDWDEHFAGQLPRTMRSVDIELWFRRSGDTRAEADAQVSQLVTDAGGTVLHRAIIDQIGYHGIKCELPIEVVNRLARGEFDAIQLVKSANVMYLRAAGQVTFEPTPDTDVDPEISERLTAGTAVACLFDGLPVTNHPLLQGRLDVYDPDDFESTLTLASAGTELRWHPPLSGVTAANLSRFPLLDLFWFAPSCNRPPRPTIGTRNYRSTIWSRT